MRRPTKEKDTYMVWILAQAQPLTWPVASVIVSGIGAVIVAMVKFVPKRANGAERKQSEKLIRMEVKMGVMQRDIDRILEHLGIFKPARHIELPEEE